LIYYGEHEEAALSDPEQTLKLDLKEIELATAKRPVVVILQGSTIGQTLTLDKDRTIIGRGTMADLLLLDEVASRQHAEIIRLETADNCVEYYVNDLDSTNGTFLNGARVDSQQLLQDGDKIKIGKHLIKFALLDEFEAEFQERLHQMTMRDELTGLRSRRSLFAEIDRVITQARRNETPPSVAVLMMDLDHFKQVNDGRGHLIGSQTIRDVGHIIRDVLGSTDLAGRYGGEEYFAYVMGTRLDGLQAAERIRRSVEEHEFSGSTSDSTLKIRVTISMGVATFPDDGETALELIQRADQSLYRAKMTGRNRTCTYDRRLDKTDSFRPLVDASAIMYGPADSQ
jgi:diguanylate cyclase (GGDEF)-like protein